MNYTTHSVEETQQIAAHLAKTHSQGGIFALFGDLGAGKTTFTQGFAQGLGIAERLISPTFILMRQYKIPNNPLGKLFHLDLYRLEENTDLENLGLSEIFANPHNIVLIEWAEKLGPNLPPKTVQIQLKTVDENTREIKIEE